MTKYWYTETPNFENGGPGIFSVHWISKIEVFDAMISLGVLNFAVRQA